ncbi:ABC transporter ATP-binding protein [Paracoccus jeotgali]|uniref:ABC transporter ATP-binding protein n=1 Tax=Paracoccus jeotgali TaxID=2065379 RepID=A0A2K9MJS9_9RHOB|nr:ABC transporter ATP-binding protein [Paracoccus jeotgali]AUM75854.1 ABC transporter ATP-binding protein [Paracoccus jeotgali]
MSIALELDDVHKSFGETKIIRGANLAVRSGERVAIIGPNGAGKSTMFHLISGRLHPTSGQIRLRGEAIGGLRPHEVYRRGLARSFQITNVFQKLTTFQNLQCAALWSLGYRYSLWHRLIGLKDVRERAEQVLEQIGLTARRDTEANLLSYAELRALEIGITISGGAEVIMLDEPTAGMSRHESDAALALIRKVSVGKTLLVVEHDMGVVFGLADKIGVLVYGQMIAFDTPENIRGNPKVQEAYLGAVEAQERTA